MDVDQEERLSPTQSSLPISICAPLCLASGAEWLHTAVSNSASTHRTRPALFGRFCCRWRLSKTDLLCRSTSPISPSSDQFYNSAACAYLKNDGMIDYERFAKQLIVGVYVGSFSKGEQDLLVNKLADYSAKQMEYHTIRAAVLARVSISKLAENSEQRQVAMKTAQEVAMRAYA